MEKKIILILICILFVSLLSSCITSDQETLYVLSSKPEYQEFFELVNDIFLEENPEIKKIDFKTVDTDNYNTILDSKIQSKTLDVFMTEPAFMMQGTANYMLELEHQEFFDEIDPYFLEMGQFYDSFSDLKSRQLTLPMENVASVVFYNKDIFNEYNLNIPNTWEEFIIVLDFFKEKKIYPEKGKTKIEAPIMFGGKSEWPALNILNAIVADTIEINYPTFFNEIKDYDNHPNARFNNSDWIQSFEKLAEIGEYIPSLMYGIDYIQAPSHFINGRQGAMFPILIDGTWSYTLLQNADFEVGAFVLPGIESVLNEENKKNLATKPGLSLSVFIDSKKPVLSQKYLEIVFRDEVYKTFLNLTKMPSVKTTVFQDNHLIQSIFDTEKYTYVPMYDSRMTKYFPIVMKSDLISLMQGNQTATKIANDLQKRVDLTKEDWIKYIHYSHTMDN